MVIIREKEQRSGLEVKGAAFSELYEVGSFIEKE